MIGFVLFSNAVGPMDTVVKLGMNVLSRKFEFQAGESCHVDKAKPLLANFRRYLCCKPRIFKGASQVPHQASDPEPEHHGR